LDPVVIEQRIVDVEQKDGIKRCVHSDVPLGERGFANHPVASTIGAPRQVSQTGSFLVRRPGLLNDRKRSHAIDPEREPDPPRAGRA
jgi:hypothetical protein